MIWIEPKSSGSQEKHSLEWKLNTYLCRRVGALVISSSQECFLSFGISFCNKQWRAARLQEERHISPWLLFKGSNKQVLAPWKSQALAYRHCGASYGGEHQDHCWERQGGTIALCEEDQMLIKAHLEHHLLHSIERQRTWHYDLTQPTSELLRKT